MPRVFWYVSTHLSILFAFQPTRQARDVTKKMLLFAEDDAAWWTTVALQGLGILFVVWLVVRPRRGGPNAPPIVLSSPIVKVPYLGTALEFGKSPVKLVRRCYDDYGPIYTVPVRRNPVHILRKPMLCTIIFLLTFLFRLPPPK